VQGVRALGKLGDELKRIGGNAVLLIDPFAEKNFGTIIEAACRGKVSCHSVTFGGECSDEEIGRVTKIAQPLSPDMIVGVGGGKALDTAKGLAHALGLPMAAVPTLASTDAPCSSISVIYTPDGEYKRVLASKNPALVLIDTQIVADAPPRFLVAGMGDALATWFEAEDCARSYANTIAGTPPGQSALALARFCYETLLGYGVQALNACRAGVVTPALERIVEANTLLSGLGFESGGLSAAHAIHDGFTALEATHSLLHGEKVAFGTLSLLMLTDRAPQIVEEVYAFCEAVGLPTTLADINLGEVSDDDLMKVARLACAPGTFIHNEPFEVDADLVFAAIKAADAHGRNRRAAVRWEE